jgi:hypothetical protein
MPSKWRPDPLPKAFDAQGEPNKWLAKFKAARFEKWSLASRQSLQDIAGLSLYLTALGRLEEAVEVVSVPVQQVSPDQTGDYWVVAKCNSQLIRLLWSLGRTTEAEDWTALLRAHPGHHDYRAPHIRGSVEDHIREEKQIIAEVTSGALKGANARAELTVALAYACRYWVAGKVGIPGTEWFPLSEYDAMITDALNLLRLNLENAR